MAEKMTKETLRVLRLLDKAPAVEERGRELKSVRPLVARGWAAESPWQAEVDWSWREVYITPAGRRALDEATHDR